MRVTNIYIEENIDKTQRTQVILVTDGRPADLSSKFLFSEDRKIKLHTVVIANESDFEEIFYKSLATSNRGTFYPLLLPRDNQQDIKHLFFTIFHQNCNTFFSPFLGLWGFFIIPIIS